MSCSWTPNPTDLGFALICAVFALFYAWKIYVEHRWPIGRDAKDED